MSRSRKICYEIMDYLVKQGFTNEVHINEVKKAIVYVRGPDKRTINNWMNALEILGFLERKSTLVFKMNLGNCPELLVKVLQGNRQKKLM